MRQFESAFLGLILAGVLMMVIGIGLMVSSVHSSDREAVLALRLVDRTPAYTMNDAGLIKP